MRIATCSGRRAKFPYAPERKYTPCDAPKEKLFALRDFLGFDKNVIVQASCHSKDNRAMVDALDASNGRAKGVAFVGRRGDRRRAEMDGQGRRPRRALQFPQAAGRFHAARRAATHRRSGRRSLAGTSWFISKCTICPSLRTSSPRCRPTVVVDHMGTPDVQEGRRSSGEPALPPAHGPAQEFLGQGDLPGAHDASPGRPMTTWCRSAGRWSNSFPIA